MVTMKRLNPIHNQFEPLNASIEKNKIAFGWDGSKQGCYKLNKKQEQKAGAVVRRMCERFSCS